MQHTRRKLPLKISIVILGGLGLLFSRQFVRWLTENETAPRPLAEAGPAIVAEGAQSIIVRDESGQKAWEFSAATITLSADHLFYTATGVQRAILYRKGQPFLQLRAQQVRLNQQTRDMEASGAVDASGPDGFSLHSERANWKEQVQHLECPGDVKATLRGLKIDTKGVFYDARTSKLHCPLPVLATSERASLQGANIVLDTKTRNVDFQQGVQIAIKPH